MAAGAFLKRAGIDAGIQFGANLTTNGGNWGDALGRVNGIQSALAGFGMNYVGNSIISASTSVTISNKRVLVNTIFNDTRSIKEFVPQAAFGIVGGAAVNSIGNLPQFKGLVIGSYMQGTIRFGQQVL
ncbi:hypothetical protein JSO62_06155 [Riemerella anatipestifer]|uniref:hypothetical protein n=1 Tax=Riemerella anatipestifer TaxID=34085 RepID=UPI0030BF3CAA